MVSARNRYAGALFAFQKRTRPVALHFPKKPFFFAVLKKLDRLLIRSFIGPFVVTFFVTLFVLVMQFFWLYMDELIGKGLEIALILELLVYMSTTLVPLALPLAVLLASIMTFGSLGENFELVALKSSGISLNRFIRPLLGLIIAVSFGAFLFNNYVIPVANLKALSMLYDLRNSKPTLNIRAGQFNNDIDNFSIRVGAKDKDGKTIRDIVIYDHSSGYGNDKVVLAQKGQMLPSADGSFLIFRLYNGWRYEESAGQEGSGRTQIRMHFNQWDKVFDLAAFGVNHTDQDLFAGDQKMMSMGQLAARTDSVKNALNRAAKTTKAYLAPYLLVTAESPAATKLRTALEKETPLPPAGTYKTTFAATLPDSLRRLALTQAVGNMTNSQQLMDMMAVNEQTDRDKLRHFGVEWHRKITMAAACILLFLIGAPLGAIIRKGGLGLPMIAAISLFLIWYIISFAGERLATGGKVTPLLGMWGSTLLLLPLALFIIRKARNDSPLFQKEPYLRAWAAARRFFVPKSKKIVL